MRRLRRGLIVALLLCLAPAGVRAQDAPKAATPVRIAVLDMRVTGQVDPKQVEGLNSFLVSEASRRKSLQVTSSADIRTVLGFEAERQMLECSGDNCLVEVAGALGVDYVIASEISRLGRVWLLSLNLLDMSTARARARTSRRVDSEEALFDAASAGLGEILAGLAGVDPVVSGASAPLPWLRWTVAGGGAVAAIGGGLLLASAWQTYGQWQADPRSVSPETAYGAQRVSAPVGVGLALGGAALAVGSFIFIPAPGGAQVAVSAGPDRAMAAVTLRFE